MKRIATQTSVDGRFVDGNRAIGQKATQFSAEWCNAIQEELCAIVELITGAAVTGLSNHEVIDALNGDRTFRSVKVGSAELSVVPGLGESLRNLAAVSAGVIEALTMVKVGGSTWIPENGQPKIEGLYSLRAGNVGVNNLQTDSIDSLTANIDVEVKKKLVKDSADATKMLDLGPTKVNGALSVTNDAAVTGDLEVYGDATLTGSVTADGGFQTSTGDIKSTNGGLEIGGAVKFGSGSIIQATAGDESTITTALSAYAEGRTAIIVNKSSTDLQFNNAIFAKTTFQVPAYSAVSVVKVDGKVYALIGENV